MITERKREPIKGFYPEFEIGQIVYFKCDENGYAWVVDGYQIAGAKHERTFLLSRVDQKTTAFLHELTDEKPIEGAV